MSSPEQPARISISEEKVRAIVGELEERLADRFATHEDVADLREAVTADIRETEDRLRSDWNKTFRFESRRIDRRLEGQDETLKWINRWTLGTLVLVVVALLGALATLYASHHL